MKQFKASPELTKNGDIQISYGKENFLLHMDADGYGVYGISKPEDETIQFIGRKDNKYNRIVNKIKPFIQDIHKLY